MYVCICVYRCWLYTLEVLFDQLQDHTLLHFAAYTSAKPILNEIVPLHHGIMACDDILACDISFHPFHRLSPLSQTFTHFHRRLQAGEPGAVQDPDLPEGSEAPADGPAGQGESATVSSAAQGAREAGIDTAEEAVSDGAQQLRRQQSRHTPGLQRSVPRCTYACGCILGCQDCLDLLSPCSVQLADMDEMRSGTAGGGHRRL